MSISRLANAHDETFWPNHTWRDFAALPHKPRTLVVLPVHGFADHGLGLPLDAEEMVGSALLRSAAAHASAAGLTLRVLPPLRFGLTPYPSGHFGIDPETAHDHIHEIAASVKASEFTKLAFFCTSPWSRELVNAASLDTRVSLGLQTYLINLPSFGLDFHPAAHDGARSRVQAIASHILGIPPQAAETAAPADIRDAGFRPGNFSQPAPLPDGQPGLPAGTNIDDFIESIGRHISRLCAEMIEYPTLPGHPTVLSHQIQTHIPFPVSHVPPANEGAAEPLGHTNAQFVFASDYRSRYLPALTATELAGLPDKEKALVIIPVGSIEQHGLHLPVGVDAILGQAWLANALPKLPANAPVYVAPPITYGKSNEHTGYPGTVSISAKTLRRLLLALAGHLKKLGFRQIAILNTHGGNSPVVVYTLREIQTTYDLRAGMLNIPFKPSVTAQEAAFGFHAGEWETALMLACAPSLVHMDKANCEYPARLDAAGELRPENAPATFSWMTRDVSETGVMGNAAAATPEKGVQWLESASSALAMRIVELL